MIKEVALRGLFFRSLSSLDWVFSPSSFFFLISGFPSLNLFNLAGNNLKKKD